MSPTFCSQAQRRSQCCGYNFRPESQGVTNSLGPARVVRGEDAVAAVAAGVVLNVIGVAGRVRVVLAFPASVDEALAMAVRIEVMGRAEVEGFP